MPLTIPRNEEKVERARQMRHAFVSIPVIAQRLGVSKNTVYRWLDEEWAERDRVASRLAKARRTGTCQACGGPTRYNGHSTNGPSRLCWACSAREIGKGQIGKGHVQQALLHLLSERGEVRFIEISEALGISRDRVGPLVDNALKKGLIVRVRRGFYALPKTEGADS